MTSLQAIFLGVLQGLTEFLPVSSSGHLVLLQHFFGLREPELLFDILVHVATLLVVFVIYRRDVWRFVAACPGLSTVLCQHTPASNHDLAASRRLGLLLLIANVPTALIGLVFSSTFEHLFAAPWAVGMALLVTGTILWSLKRTTVGHSDVQDMRVWHALLLGLVQGLAITPGLSRSGSTIVVALWCGLRREFAARFSFLMAIPAILGAMLLQGSALWTLSGDQIGLLLGGMVSALLVGYVALRFLLRLLMQGNLWRFAIYCWLIGVGAILASL
jgi:undecaprenyl-diphosphatase